MCFADFTSIQKEGAKVHPEKIAPKSGFTYFFGKCRQHQVRKESHQMSSALRGLQRSIAREKVEATDV